jgi:hypothetical protein
MSGTCISDENETARIALQPDGLVHLVTGGDWLRSICGIRLVRHQIRYIKIYRFGSDSNHCRQCAAMLDQRARFPQNPNEELKPILERIAKLFALAESPNPNEAAAAMARADALLQKYNLTRAVVDDASQQTAEKGATDSLGANVQKYKYVLARAAAHLHDVEWYIHQHLRGGDSWRSAYDKYVIFLGLPANVSTALLTFPYLLASAEAFYQNERGANGSGRDYKQGFADRIWLRVRELKRAALDNPGLADLIKVGNQVARQAMHIEEFFFSGGGLGFYDGARNQAAYDRGYRDGARVDLHGARTSRLLDRG